MVAVPVHKQGGLGFSRYFARMLGAFNRERAWHFTLCCGVVTDWPAILIEKSKEPFICGGFTSH